MAENKVFGITLGGLAPPINSQLKKQGLDAPEKECALWQRMSESVTFLRIHGVLTDGESDKAGTRLVKKIGKSLRERRRT